MRAFFQLMFGVAVFLAFQSIGSCVKPSNATRAARNFGFANVEIVEHSWFFLSFRGCGVSDIAMFPLRGKNAVGEPLRGVYVCTGMFKGSTVRSD